MNNRQHLINLFVKADQEYKKLDKQIQRNKPFVSTTTYEKYFVLETLRDDLTRILS
jgi:hypothetical protein